MESTIETLAASLIADVQDNPEIMEAFPTTDRLWEAAKEIAAEMLAEQMEELT